MSADYCSNTTELNYTVTDFSKALKCKLYRIITVDKTGLQLNAYSDVLLYRGTVHSIQWEQPWDCKAVLKSRKGQAQ